MKLSELKKALENIKSLSFSLPNGMEIPVHFHITEVGQIDKKFIDCGGTIRFESKVSLQLWHSVDEWHRLTAEKLNRIIDLSIEKLNIGDHEIEVEYQGDSIQKFGLEWDGNSFQLTTLMTDCLAKDTCGIPVEKVKVELSTLSNKSSSCCTPGGGCC